MEKPLQDNHGYHWYRVAGVPHVWDANAEELLENAKKALNGEPFETFFLTSLYGNLGKWLNRYVDEGITEKLLDEVNQDLYKVRYSKSITPQHFLTKNIGRPKTLYMAEYDVSPDPVGIAADDFSRLLSNGDLDNLKRCQLDGCGNLFVGNKRSKWCSKGCGSKHRVRQKRKRDSE